jgi:hypothetical protein
MAYDWLSWGNSWITCGWKRALQHQFNISFVSPGLYCIRGNHSDDNAFPCAQHPIIFHHRYAAQIFIKEFFPMRYEKQNQWNDPFIEVPGFSEKKVNVSELGSYKTNHICEYMITIDKIKEPHHIHDMHRLAGNKTDPHFRNLSLVLMNDGNIGWQIILDEFERRYNSSL